MAMAGREKNSTTQMVEYKVGGEGPQHEKLAVSQVQNSDHPPYEGKPCCNQNVVRPQNDAVKNLLEYDIETVHLNYPSLPSQSEIGFPNMIIFRIAIWKHPP